VNCKYFDVEKPCRYQKYENRALTFHRLILLVEIGLDKDIDDKDFLVKLLTGKSIKEGTPFENNNVDLDELFPLMYERKLTTTTTSTKKGKERKKLKLKTNKPENTKNK